MVFMRIYAISHGIPDSFTVSPGEFHRHECMFKTLSDAINIQVGWEMGPMGWVDAP